MATLPPRSTALGLLVALLPACSTPASHAAEVPRPEPPGVHGRVTVSGAPEPRRWQLDEFMWAVCNEDEYVEEAWLVGPAGGLANCVVTLQRLDQQGATPQPVADAVYAKVGPRYEPRVLVVTPGTPVTLRNVDSPCRGFATSARRNAGFNITISAGSEHVTLLERPERLRVRCDLREYMRGAIVCVGTPYYTLTDAEGRFELTDVPDGTYRVGLWHEGLGTVKDLEPGEIRVTDGRARVPTYALNAP